MDEAFSICLNRADRVSIQPVMEAMDIFTSAVLKWRRTHYSIAVRMLGERSGTGYTEGTPYLRSVRKIPIFRNRDAEVDACPFSSKDGRSRG